MTAEAPVLNRLPDFVPAKEPRVMGVPRHVLIIPDNNRTWANARGLSIREGYNQGAKKIVEVAGAAANIEGLDFLTVNLASRDNIVKRKPKEMADLWEAVRENMFENGLPDLVAHGARIRVIGNMEGVPDFIKEGFESLSEISKDNKGFALSFVLGYDVEQEKRDAEDAANNVIYEKGKTLLGYRVSMTAKLIDQHKYLPVAGLPDIDALIRTGERRTSGIFPEPIVQAEHAYFEDLTWPEFGAEQFEHAIAELASRKKKGGA
jgi:undecaprenyl diphosphate synthase